MVFEKWVGKNTHTPAFLLWFNNSDRSHPLGSHDLQFIEE
jgi:hypothetical protein